MADYRVSCIKNAVVCALQSMVRVIKSKRMRWGGHLTCIGIMHLEPFSPGTSKEETIWEAQSYVKG
jgi:hypothetical protein